MMVMMSGVTRVQVSVVPPADVESVGHPGTVQRRLGSLRSQVQRLGVSHVPVAHGGGPHELVVGYRSHSCYDGRVNIRRSVAMRRRTFVQRLHAFHAVRYRYGTGWCHTCYLSCCCCCGGGCCGCRLMLLLLLLLLLLDLGMVRVVSVLLERRSWRHAARRTGRSVRRCSWSLSKTQKKLLFNSQFDIVQTRIYSQMALKSIALPFLRSKFSTAQFAPAKSTPLRCASKCVQLPKQTTEHGKMRRSK